MLEGTPIIVRRKKVVAGAHHGGSWKVAYADFVTAMMAFFMVMWIMGMDPATRSMVQGYFNDPLGFVKNPPKSRSVFQLPGSPAPKPGQSQAHNAGILNAEREELEKVKEKFQKELEESKELKGLSEHVQLKFTSEGLRIELMESAASVFFESGRAQIRPAGLELINTVGPVLAASKRAMILEGHTDSAPYPSATYTNWDLSTDRAGALRRALTSAGVPLDRFLEVRGYADKKPLRPDQPTHFSNRRVSILLPYVVGAEKGASAAWPAEAAQLDIRPRADSAVQISPNLAEALRSGR
jgi:chemotaxis protein MotB